jgi:hypothetical protein
MKAIIAIVCLGSLMSAGPVGAQQTKTYLLTVGHHKNVEVSDKQVDEILTEASKVLKKCNVELKRKGSVGLFKSSDTPASINKAADRDAVHKENFDIKVVKSPIFFCRVDQMGGVGCAWDPPPPPAKQKPRHRSMIIANLEDAKLAGKIWAHEFGHRTGLPHRSDKSALMACKVEDAQIGDKECKCFRGGPGSCDREPESAEQCAIQ